MKNRVDTIGNIESDIKWGWDGYNSILSRYLVELLIRPVNLNIL